MITFNKIYIEGFCSYIIPFEYSLNKEGINLIQGLNGSGKSTIFSALYWVLFGKTLKEGSSITPWESIKPQDFKGTKVSLELVIPPHNLTYRITRCKDYKGKVLGYNGKNRIVIQEEMDGREITFKNKNEAQKFIEDKMLHMGSKLFKNSILFGQKLTRLLQESGPEQKKIFEEIFDVFWIDQVKERVSEKFKNLSSEMSLLDIELDKLKLTYKHKKQVLQYERAAIKTFNEVKSNKLADLEDKINDEKRELTKILADKENLEKLREEELKSRAKIKKLKNSIEPLEQLFKRKSQVEVELKNLKTKVSNYMEELYSIRSQDDYHHCKLCGQELPEEKIKEIFSKNEVRVNELENLINPTERNLNKAASALNKLNSSIEKTNKLDRSIKAEEEGLEQLLTMGLDQINYRPESEKRLKNSIRTLIDKKRETMDEKPNLEKVESLKKELQNLKQSILPKIQYKKKLKKGINIHRWMLDDPLSNRGLKSYIFNNMLSQINTSLENYYTFLGYQVVLTVNMESFHKNIQPIIYRGNEEVPYNDLSGGQQQLVDICLGFAINDVIISQNDMNLLLMDEIFEYLDHRNIELVSDLINRKSRGISIHFMSHKSEITLPYSQVLKLELDLKQGTKVI